MTARPDKDGLSRISLGFAPSTGRAAVDECVSFKQRLRETMEQRDPDGVWLETFVEGERRGIQVTFDDGIPGAEIWARRAKEAATVVWRAVAKQAAERTVA